MTLFKVRYSFCRRCNPMDLSCRSYTPLVGVNIGAKISIMKFFKYYNIFWLSVIMLTREGVATTELEGEMC